MTPHRRAHTYLAVRSAGAAAAIAVTACGALAGVLLGRVLTRVRPGAGSTAICSIATAVVAGPATAAVVAWCVHEPSALRQTLAPSIGLAAAAVAAASVARFRIVLERTVDVADHDRVRTP